LAELIARSKNELEYLDLSFIPTKDVNDSVVSAVSLCGNVHTLILTGSTNVSDSSIGRLSNLHKLK
jgi:F-box/leucine-rich repeat protein 2/20